MCKTDSRWLPSVTDNVTLMSPTTLRLQTIHPFLGLIPRAKVDPRTTCQILKIRASGIPPGLASMFTHPVSYRREAVLHSSVLPARVLLKITEFWSHRGQGRLRCKCVSPVLMLLRRLDSYHVPSRKGWFRLTCALFTSLTNATLMTCQLKKWKGKLISWPVSACHRSMRSWVRSPAPT